ncbi:hypothetical protein [Oxynema aestuarii]|uniref:Uncharacterized protein n=1 Tax=Oxynema aestuarii AP17 TaxID=2064643 RepID=A0A6H1U0Q3_9CYAN|nr:hypothetical protein [Oxynema aestuarii]QIZ71740.1 hypothetical protein HCG48_15060 [Oxynema aestuarii AP17]
MTRVIAVCGSSIERVGRGIGDRQFRRQQRSGEFYLVGGTGLRCFWRSQRGDR